MKLEISTEDYEIILKSLSEQKAKIVFNTIANLINAKEKYENSLIEQRKAEIIEESKKKKGAV